MEICDTVGQVLNVVLDILAGAIRDIMAALQPVANLLVGTLKTILDWLCDRIQDLTHYIGDDKKEVDFLSAALAILIGAMIAYKASLMIGATIQAFGALLTWLTSPMGLVVAAITAIIAIGVVLVKHWDDIKRAAKTLWENVKSAFQSFTQWLGTVFRTDWTTKISALGVPINALLSAIQGVWIAIKGIFVGLINFIRGVFTGDWRSAWSGVVSIFSGIFGGMAQLIKTPLNAVIDLVNSAIRGINRISVDIPSWVPFMGGGHLGFNIRQIPRLAKGGIAVRPTQAIIGEAGQEAVLPLQNNTGWMDVLAERIASQIVVTGTTTTPVKLDGREIAKIVTRWQKSLNVAANGTAF